MPLEIADRRAVLTNPFTARSFVPLAATAAIALAVWLLAPEVLYPVRVLLLVVLRLDSFASPGILAGVLVVVSGIWLLRLKSVTVEFDAATRQVTMSRSGLLGFRSSQVFPFGDVLSLGTDGHAGVLALRAQTPVRFPLSFASHHEQEAALEEVRRLTGFPKLDLPGSQLQLEVDGQTATLTSAPIGRIAGPVLAAAVVSGCYLAEIYSIPPSEEWERTLGRALIMLSSVLLVGLGVFAFLQPQVRADFNTDARSVTVQSRSFFRTAQHAMSYDAIASVGLERCLRLPNVVKAAMRAKDGQRYVLSSRCGARPRYDHVLTQLSAFAGIARRDLC